MSDHDWHRPMEDNPYCDEQLLSLPTMYQWTCSKCGAVAYRDCNEGEPPRDGCTSKSANDEVSNLVDRYEKRIAELESKLEELTAELAEEKANAEGHWKNANKWAEMNAELQFKVDELTERNEYLESRHCEWSDPDSLGDGCMLRKDEYMDGLKAKIAELQARLDSEAQHAREGWGLAMEHHGRIAELESLVRDMQALDRMHHGPFSWERIDKVQDMRGSINARLIKMGFVEEVGE